MSAGSCKVLLEAPTTQAIDSSPGQAREERHPARDVAKVHLPSQGPGGQAIAHDQGGAEDGIYLDARALLAIGYALVLRQHAN